MMLYWIPRDAARDVHVTPHVMPNCSTVGGRPAEILLCISDLSTKSSFADIVICGFRHLQLFLSQIIKTFAITAFVKEALLRTTNFTLICIKRHGCKSHVSCILSREPRGITS